MARKGSLSAKLEEYKQAHQLTVDTLSEKSGISRPTIYKILSGEKSERNLRQKTIDRIHDLGIKLREYAPGARRAVHADAVDNDVDSIKTALKVLHAAGIELPKADVERLMNRVDPSEATITDFKHWFRDATARDSKNNVTRFVVSVSHGREHASFSWFDSLVQKSKVMRRVQRRRWRKLRQGKVTDSMAAASQEVPTTVN